jgi:RNA polymerase sigma-70 factor (ECF subfamily)
MIGMETRCTSTGGEAVESDSITFEAVYRDYYPRIKRYLTRLIAFDDAEDVAQEVFLKISRSLDGFRGESSLSTWIYRIATNAAVDRVRSPAYRARLSSAPVEETCESGEIAAAAEDQAPSAEEDVIRREMSECVQNLIFQLPDSYRTVLALSETEGMKNSEIAEVLGVSLETVKIRLHRARARLRETLEANCSFYHDPCNTLLCDIKREPYG